MSDHTSLRHSGRGSYGDRQGGFGRSFVQDLGGILGCGPPAGVHLPAVDTAAAGVRPFALALAPTVSFVLSQTEVPLVGAASLLELNVDGERGLMDRGGVDAHSVSPQPGAERDEQAAQLPLEGLVEVEVDERVVDVGALGEEGGEDEALGGHVPVLLVENEEEGHDGVRGPGDHETQAYAEKHLQEEVTDHRRLLTTQEKRQRLESVA